MSDGLTYKNKLNLNNMNRFEKLELYKTFNSFLLNSHNDDFTKRLVKFSNKNAFNMIK